MDNQLQGIMQRIADWSDAQFGEGRSPIPILHHLKKEVPELIEAIENYQELSLNENGAKETEIALKKVLFEYADCFMLILDSARTMGLNSEMLYTYTNWKLEINKNRQWGIPDENGVVEHIRDAVSEI